MAFLRQAMRSLTCAPQTATLDSYALSHRAVRELKADGSLPMDTMLLASTSPIMTDVVPQRLESTLYIPRGREPQALHRSIWVHSGRTAMLSQTAGGHCHVNRVWRPDWRPTRLTA